MSHADQNAADQKGMEEAVRKILIPMHNENVATAAAWREKVDGRLEALEDKAEVHERFQSSSLQTQGQMLAYFDQLLGSPMRPQIPGMIPQMIAKAEERDQRDSKRWHTLNDAMQTLVNQKFITKGGELANRRMAGWAKWLFGIIGALGGADLVKWMLHLSKGAK